MIDHKAIFHYLNPEGCWHKGIGDGTLASCEKCGEFWTYTDREPGDWPNPDYTTEHGFFLLLEGLKNVNDGDFRVEIRQTPLTYTVWIRKSSLRVGLAWSEDIRIALAEATMQVIAKDGEL